MASTSISKTFSNAGNRQKWTWSAWIKRSATSNSSASNGYTLWNCEGSSTSDNFIFQITVNGGGSGGATDSIALHTYGGDVFRTTPLLRDVNSWYHIVLALDTTQGTATNRIKLYVNGELQSYSQESNFPAQNFSMGINRAAKHCVGSHGTNANYYFDGSMSHVHFCDGYQYAASDFGETDSTTGEWKIKTSPSVSYGTNGFFILKDGNSLTDQSPNSNNFSSNGGTLTKTEDSPSNVFATWNKLDWGTTYFTLTNGSTTAQSNASAFTYGVSTLGVNSGKFYWEVEYDAKNGGNRFPQIGITSTQTTNTQYELGHYANDWCWYINNTTSTLRNNNSDTSWGNYYQEGDIIGVALDCTNNKLYFSKNGTWQESGDPSASNNGISITAPSSTPLGFYFPAICYYDSTHRGTFKANFGNGYFGTTAVSSAGTNASGNGIFEYDVPTGYTALSTKGLNL